jgi:hypothetical protein
VAERDVGQRQAAMPEQDGLVVALAPRPEPGDDLAELGVEAALVQLAALEHRPQRAEAPRARLAEIVHQELVGDVRHADVDRAHRAVGHDERALRDPFRAQQRPWLDEARGLDHDVGAAHAALPVLRHHHALAEVALEPRGEGLAALGPARVHADLVEVEDPVHQPHVPVGRAARADMAEHLRAPPREVPRADRGDGTGAHVGDHRGVDDRLRHPGPAVHQQQDRQLRGQPVQVVVVEVGDDLHAGGVHRAAHRAAQHVEVPVRDARLEVHARLDHRLAAPLRGELRLDRGEDLVVRHRQRLDVEAVEVGDVDRRHRFVFVHHAPPVAVAAAAGAPGYRPVPSAIARSIA